MVVAAWADGRQSAALPLDPLPRVVPVAEWARLAAGVEQRHRALNAFLADAYRAAGRRRSDPDRDPEVVRAGALPRVGGRAQPGPRPRRPSAWPGRVSPGPRWPAPTWCGPPTARGSSPRTTCARPTGSATPWRTGPGPRAPLPGAVARRAGLADPADAVPLLRAGAARRRRARRAPGRPRLALLTAGESDNAGEHRLLAEALGVPLVRAADLWPRLDGGIEVAGRRRPGAGRRAVPAVRRRPLGAYRTPDRAAAGRGAGRRGAAGTARPGQRAGQRRRRRRLHLRLRAGDDPLLPRRGAAAGTVPTWVLADEEQWAQVRDRLHELVVEPVEGYGGRGAVVGPTPRPARLAQLHAEVAAARTGSWRGSPSSPRPCRRWSTARLQPRHVDLRVFSAAGGRRRGSSRRR